MRMFFYPLPRMPFIETRMPTVGDFYESLFPTIWEEKSINTTRMCCTQITMNHPKSSKSSKSSKNHPKSSQRIKKIHLQKND